MAVLPEGEGGFQVGARDLAGAVEEGVEAGETHHLGRAAGEHRSHGSEARLREAGVDLVPEGAGFLVAAHAINFAGGSGGLGDALGEGLDVFGGQGVAIGEALRAVHTGPQEAIGEAAGDLGGGERRE